MDHARLMGFFQAISSARDLSQIMEAAKNAARTMLAADGVTFVLRQGDLCFYADEEAIAPLWKGQRFHAERCISGWAMAQRAVVAIEDIYADPRVPHDIYRPTFVRSVLMAPAQRDVPVAAIGVYWAQPYRASERDRAVLETIATVAGIGVAHCQALREAKEASAARDQFLDVAAHELRTPLHALQMHVEALQLLAPVAGDGRTPISPKIDRLRKSVERMRDLVDQLLGSSRIVAGRLSLVLDEFPFCGLVVEVAERLTDLLTASGSRLTLTLPYTGVGRWDRGLVDIAISNLLGNAVKYGQGKDIAVSVVDAADRVQLVVEDGGGGIAPEDREHIFERFRRGKDALDKPGFGLGLWMVREIAMAHSGHVTVENGARGAKFILALPKIPAK